MIKCRLTFKDFKELLAIDKFGQSIQIYDDDNDDDDCIISLTTYAQTRNGDDSLRISLIDYDVVLSVSSQKTFFISQFILKNSESEKSEKIINKFEFILNEQQQQKSQQKFSFRPFKFK